jgi:regulator of protease activity HflC (stomatin/prohibitin superfamily)
MFGFAAFMGLVAAAGFIWGIVYFPIRRIIVFEYEKVLFYRFGKFVKVLEPGLHFFCRWFTEIKKVDIRPKFVTISNQEVTTSDGIVLRITLAAQYQLQDLDLAINKIANPYEEALHLVLQLALRQVISSVAIDDFLHKRGEFTAALMSIAAKKAGDLGLSLMLFELKDVMLPGEFKKIFAEVTKAKQESQAVLERARAETAALRSLANAATMIKDNPALIQLRLLQSTGNTYVMGVPGLDSLLKK